MVVLANTLTAIAVVLNTVLDLYFWVVLIACIMSWVNPDPMNPIVRTLRALTEPVFYRIRRAMPFTYVNGLDLSPLVVLLAIKIVDTVVVRSLLQYAASM
ncbi:MAG: YggT family protein [Desulfovibrionaceae bacterium]|nr:YggT family protein [Desulfovibrionaceae bacterium]